MAGETAHDAQKPPLASGEFAGAGTAPAQPAASQAGGEQSRSGCSWANQEPSSENPIPSVSGRKRKTRMGTQNKKQPDNASGPYIMIFKRMIPAKTQVFLTSSSITAAGPKSSERHPELKGNTWRPGSASHHPTRAISNTTQQAQQDRARVVIATTSCIYISPFIRVNSREGKQAGLKSKRWKPASPLETLVKANPVVSSASLSPELAARHRHSTLGLALLSQAENLLLYTLKRFPKHVTYSAQAFGEAAHVATEGRGVAQRGGHPSTCLRSLGFSREIPGIWHDILIPV